MAPPEPPGAAPPSGPAAASTVSSTEAIARRKKPVQWLSVRQLLHTAAEVVQAMMFARFADKRETMASCPREFFRLFPEGAAPETVWVDYVADTGDGFDATFATARCLAGTAPGVGVQLDLDALPEFKERPRQAHLLVLGGDEVYPVASMPEYEDRLTSVLREAARLAKVPPAARPPVVALPGNHDWYDGLTAFRRYFCESWVLHNRSSTHVGGTAPLPLPIERDDVGGWGAFQSRSYFAVQLTEDWWLWAVDSQLDAAIDAEQLAYFNDARARLGAADIILCTATPCWLEAGDSGETPYRPEEETPLFTMLWFIDRILDTERDRVRVVLTGDKHHFAHYAPVDVPVSGPPLITCGGGGAFLSSTHHLPETLNVGWQPWSSTQPHTCYKKDLTYPTADESKAETAKLKFLKAAWLNGPVFPLLTAVVSVLLFLAVLLHRPLWIVSGSVVVVGLLLPYAASGIKGHLPGWSRRFALIVLTVGHTVLYALPGVLASILLGWHLDEHPWYAYVAAFAGLALAGPLAFVTYLHLADRFGYHTLEAFSALRLEKYKCHLRIAITGKDVVIHVIGMNSVPQARGRADLAGVVPDAELITTIDVKARKR